MLIFLSFLLSISNAKSLMQPYPKSQLKQQKSFSFYESCESMPVQILGHDPTTGRTRTVSVDVYRPRLEKRGSSVLILPLTGGVNVLDFGYAERLCQKGVETWVLTEWDRGVRDYSLGLDLSSHDQTARQSLSAVHQIIEHMPGRIGLIGTSAGAILAAVAAAQEPRIKVAVFIAGGADLPQILSATTLTSLSELRNRRLALHGWSLNEYQNQLRSQISIDPLKFSLALKSKKIGSVIAKNDQIVPTRSQLLLEKISGATRLLEYESSHQNSILRAGFLDSYKIENFLIRYL